ncbi:hypothetical protein C0J52_25071 [Blattella germanica]|nr:hypothetical protein C0J52_25071 [Blattella germanica]
MRLATGSWEIRAPNKCELNCRASGFRFYATLNKTAVDGTPCQGANNDRWVCVSGFCKVRKIFIMLLGIGTVMLYCHLLI